MIRREHTSAQLQPKIVFVGDNSRRKRFMELALERDGFPQLTPSDDAEMGSDDTKLIAAAKTQSAFDQAEQKPDHSYLVGADIMPYIGTTALRKPGNEIGLLQNFELLSAQMRKRKPPTYRAQSHTSVAYVNGSATLEQQQSFGVVRQITLTQEAAQWLATPWGVGNYLRHFARFYDRSFKFTKVAGFCSILLTALGAVQSIDSVVLSQAEQKTVHDTIRNLTLTLLAPVSPQAMIFLLEKMKGSPLQQVERDAMFARLHAWPMIDETVQKVLEWREQKHDVVWQTRKPANSPVTKQSATR